MCASAESYQIMCTSVESDHIVYASAESDQHLFFWLSDQYHTFTSYINFQDVAKQAGEPYLVFVFSWQGLNVLCYNLLSSGFACYFFVVCWFFFQNKKCSRMSSEWHTVWIQIRPNKIVLHESPLWIQFMIRIMQPWRDINLFSMAKHSK